MLNVIFVAPYPAPQTMRFARAAASLGGVRLLGIFMKAPANVEALGFSDHVVVDDVFRADRLVAAARAMTPRWGVAHRMVGILEPLQVPLAHARQTLGLRGPDVGTALRFRDKATMKEALLAAGVPTARHARVTHPAHAHAFARDTGFPLIIKPLDGAGCKRTWRIHNDAELERALALLHPSPHEPAIVEEFLTGREATMESVVIGGKPVFWSFSHYYPTPLEVKENPWMQWCVLLPRNVDTPLHQRAKSLGQATIEALGLRAATTHMEWFEREDGSLAVGEIAMRPPGAQLADMTSVAHDRDFFIDWARANIYESFEGTWERNWAVGTAFLRGQGLGRIRAITGIGAAQDKVGSLVVAHRLPTVGAHPNDTYEGDGWVMLKHQDTEVVRRALLDLITTVRVHHG
ncbi:MAG: ATP-grasp domain-containing protein [Myxococcota bacterium]